MTTSHSLRDRFQAIESSLEQLETTLNTLYQNHITHRIALYQGHLKSQMGSSFNALHYQNPHVILFYKYFSIPKKELFAHRSSIEAKCYELGLEGKIRLAEEGINGTLAGEHADLSTMVHYLQNTFATHFRRTYEERICHERTPNLSTAQLASTTYQAEDIDVKWYEGKTKENFPGLVVRVVKELCTLGINETWTPKEPQGTHLDPHAFHQLVKEKIETNDDSTIIIDCRNAYEWEVGRFPQSICPPTRRFSDFPQFIDENLDKLKDKRVLMCCTGGIRCERGSAYLKLRGIEEVYQLAGGIFRYVEALQDDTLFEGSNFVFDNNGYLKATSKSVSECHVCHEVCDNEHRFCSTAGCKALLLCCDKCFEAQGNLTYCCSECREHGCAWEKKLKLKRHEERLHKKTRREPAIKRTQR